MAAQLDKDQAAPHILRAIALAQQGNIGKAKAAFDRAKVLDTEDPDIEKLSIWIG